MNCPKDKVVDHINGDTLDNRKQNLRICTKAENNRNRRVNSRLGTVPYKGVYKRKNSKINSYRASVSYQDKTYNLGHYNTPEEAAEVYNNKATELFGEFANLNKIPKEREKST